MEDLSLHRRSLDNSPLLVAQPVEPRREQNPDRGGNLHHREVAGRDPEAVLPLQEAVIHQHPEHLLHEQRVALRRRLDPNARVGCQGGSAE
jgi:hypothetical protein